MKAERSAGEDRRVALATKFKRMLTLYYYLRCGDLRSPGVTERSDSHSDYSTTMMVTMMMKDDLRQKWRVKLIFKAPAVRTGIVECLKIIDVGCNLKQFGVEADLRCIFHFRP